MNLVAFSWRNPSLAVVTVAVAALALSACTPQTTGTKPTNGTAPNTSPSVTAPGAASPPAGGSPTYQPVSDIPIPPNTRINTERSMILGGPDRWFGKVVLVLERASTLAYAYYAEQMPTFGWEPVMATQGKVSELTFLRGDRTAHVEIAPAALRGSEVTITVSPRPGNPASASGASPSPPAPSAGSKK